MFRRPRDLVVVPNVIGMSPSKAKREADHAGLWLRGPEADAGPIGKSDMPTGVITAQAPKSGSLVDPGSALAVWIDRNDDGRGGIREPRRPLPDPKDCRRGLHVGLRSAVGHEPQ
ncbi:PASTA domain-containing protein [Rhodococcus sp. WS4]|nr:PASTA domain-containing protein [Rhodococcus sp. WS4]